MGKRRAVACAISISSKINTDILEVGGGSRTHILLKGARYTVLDISKEQLERNKDAAERILGDAQTTDYGDRHFDACVFWDVLSVWKARALPC